MKTIAPVFMFSAICCTFLAALPQQGLALAQGGLGALAQSGLEGPVVVGEYRNRFVRTDAGWRFAERISRVSFVREDGA